MQINAAARTALLFDSFDHCHKHNFLIDLVINHKLCVCSSVCVCVASWVLYETDVFH